MNVFLVYFELGKRVFIFLHSFILWQLDTYILTSEIQKQPSRGVLRKKCAENMQQIHSRTSMLKCDFNKVAKLWTTASESCAHETKRN